jgi:hypothetical protein
MTRDKILLCFALNIDPFFCFVYIDRWDYANMLSRGTLLKGIEEHLIVL